MKLVIQRVNSASVAIASENEIYSHIGRGLLILCGVGEGDTISDAEALAKKTAALRIFNDEAGKMNLSVTDISGEALVVSQFTLFADCRHGNRPAFISAAVPHIANALYLRYAGSLAERGVPVKTGVFGAHMHIALENDGPVTILLDSRELGRK